jgi:hypothetical protein
VRSRRWAASADEENIGGFPLLPTLTVNGTFMREFVSADAPCFALGMIEERKRQCGLVALRPDKPIPPAVCDGGFRFGHTLLGNASFEVVHFAFQFYGFGTYNALVNPNNPLARAVVTAMVESGDYFFALISDGGATTFRSEIGQGNLTLLKSFLPRIRRSQTTEAQYEKAVASFTRNPDPAGTLLRWVCQDDAGYLDLTEDRFELTPANGQALN